MLVKQSQGQPSAGPPPASGVRGPRSSLNFSNEIRGGALAPTDVQNVLARSSAMFQASELVAKSEILSDEVSAVSEDGTDDGHDQPQLVRHLSDGTLDIVEGLNGKLRCRS